MIVIKICMEQYEFIEIRLISFNASFISNKSGFYFKTLVFREEKIEGVYSRLPVP